MAFFAACAFCYFAGMLTVAIMMAVVEHFDRRATAREKLLAEAFEAERQS